MYRTNKEIDQFDTQRLTHIVVLITGFVEKKTVDLLVKSNALRSKFRKSGKRLKLKITISMACKRS